MEHSTCNQSLVPLLFSLPWLLVSVNAYKNYTVGDSLGWYDNLLKPNVDYQKWASDKSFSLGDFLIFNTDSNHSVVQTYNFTTYTRCDYENDESNNTTEWSTADPSSTSPQPVSVSVPLVKEGTNYFFSGDYDGEQCKFGQHFKINVTHGQGLPPGIGTQSSAEAPAPLNPDSGSDDSVPDTLVPSNFDHPKQSSDDDNQDKGKEKSGAVSFLWESKIFLVLSILNLIF